MALASGRDVEATRTAVAGWLAARLGVRRVEVGELSSPKAGFSNETIFLTARWHDGAAHRRDLVLRIQPTRHQLFVEPDVLADAALIAELGRHEGVPVPRVLFTEPDPAVLGAPFFVMERLRGQVPGDVPSWHVRGWTTALDATGVARLQDNGLTALAALHRLDWRDGFEFLDRGRAGRAWPVYLEELQRWWEWSAPSRIFDAADFAEVYRTLRAGVPADIGRTAHDRTGHDYTGHDYTGDDEGIVWGDARVGNIMYDEDLAVVALFDWETATLGPPEIDLGWWLMFEDFLAGAQGVTPLPGTPDRAATIGRYEELTGRRVRHIDWFEALACVVMAITNSRLGVLLMTDHGLDDATAGQYARRSIRMAAQRLSHLG